MSNSRDGEPVPLPHHSPTAKNFLTSSLNLSSVSMNPFPSVLSLHAFVKSPSPALFEVPFRYWKVLQCVRDAFSAPC